MCMCGYNHKILGMLDAVLRPSAPKAREVAPNNPQTYRFASVSYTHLTLPTTPYV